MDIKGGMYQSILTYFLDAWAQSPRCMPFCVPRAQQWGRFFLKKILKEPSRFSLPKNANSWHHVELSSTTFVQYVSILER